MRLLDFSTFNFAKLRNIKAIAPRLKNAFKEVILNNIRNNIRNNMLNNMLNNAKGFSFYCSEPKTIVSFRLV